MYKINITHIHIYPTYMGMWGISIHNLQNYYDNHLAYFGKAVKFFPHCSPWNPKMWGEEKKERTNVILNWRNNVNLPNSAITCFTFKAFFLSKYMFWPDTMFQLVPYLLLLFMKHKFLLYDAFILMIISNTFFRITDVLVFKILYDDNHFNVVVFKHSDFVKETLGDITFHWNLFKIAFEFRFLIWSEQSLK